MQKRNEPIRLKTSLVFFPINIRVLLLIIPNKDPGFLKSCISVLISKINRAMRPQARWTMAGNVCSKTSEVVYYHTANRISNVVPVVLTENKKSPFVSFLFLDLIT